METKFIKNLDLQRNGVATEVTIMRKIEHGKDDDNKMQYELWFIRNDELDAIDRTRLLEILQKSARVKDFQELYFTMAEVTLGNGMNALDYFHQYVKILYPSGKIMRPKEGRSAVTQRSTYT